MAAQDSTIEVRIGFMPSSHAIADEDHPGLLRAGERASAPYVGDSVDFHVCPAVDMCQDDAVQPDLLRFGFDTVDLSAFDSLQQAFARVGAAGRITDEDASTIRSSLDGATLRSSGTGKLTVMYIADEGFIMRKSGPNGMSVVGPRSTGMNDHGVATSIHADQDVYGTPLTQLMDGRAPSLFRHDSPDGRNHDAGLMLVNLWIPLQQITQPLTLADGRSIDRRRHQLRYGLATTSFLERDDDMVINDIWTLPPRPGSAVVPAIRHGPPKCLRVRHAEHASRFVHPAGRGRRRTVLPRVGGRRGRRRRGRRRRTGEAVSTVADLVAPALAPPALRDAIAQMVTVAETAAEDPAAVCGEGSADWLAASRASRRRVVRMSLELRMVVSVEPAATDLRPTCRACHGSTGSGARQGVGTERVRHRTRADQLRRA